LELLLLEESLSPAQIRKHFNWDLKLSRLKKSGKFPS